jgi:CPA2 family monovalent cation:H+ antiporter-2
LHIPFLPELLTIFALAVVVVLVCHRFRIPSIVGLLLTGVVAGPYGLGLVRASQEVEVLAEVGVVMLLFSIGLEFSLARLVEMRRLVLVGGAVQVGLSGLFGAAGALLLGATPAQAVLSGFLVSLSSTAIVMRLVQESGRMGTPAGRTIVGVLLFQDVIALPMMMLVPALARWNGAEAEVVFSPQRLLGGLALLALMFVAARRWVPRLFDAVAATRNREMLLLLLVVLGFGVGWLASLVGLSLPLGAFLAGMILSESDHGHQALGDILPFRAIFLSLFFVSIGMLLDVRILFDQPLLVLTLIVGIPLAKFVAGVAAGLALRVPRLAVAGAGVGLAQVGEFSFILAGQGAANGLIDPHNYQVFLAVAVISMAATPFLIQLDQPVDRWLGRLWPRWRPGADSALREPEEGLQDHVIIVGYGLSGRHLAQAVRMAAIPYVIVEANIETVRRERAAGVPIIFGDAAQTDLLQHVSVELARVLVVAVSDLVATAAIVDTARGLNESLHILVRTRYLKEVDHLDRLGADEIVPEELEASVEIFSRVLGQYLVPRERIEAFVAELRSDVFRSERPTMRSAGVLPRAALQGVELATIAIRPGSPLAGRTPRNLDLRRRFGVTLLAVVRGEHTEPMPDPDACLEAGDAVLLIGPVAAIAAIAEVNRLAGEAETIDTARADSVN